MRNLIKRCAEFIPQQQVSRLPKKIRGIYALFHKKKGYDVVYVGMTRKCVWSRINAHARSRRKKKLWTHFSLFEVNRNVKERMIRELEGIIRHIYRKDSRANSINKMRGYDSLRKRRVCKGEFKDWKEY